MKKSIKLRPKQLQQFVELQTQRQKLTDALKDTNSRLGVALELVLEEHSIEQGATEFVLEGDSLVFEVPDPETKLKKK